MKATLDPVRDFVEALSGDALKALSDAIVEVGAIQAGDDTDTRRRLLRESWWRLERELGAMMTIHEAAEYMGMHFSKLYRYADNWGAVRVPTGKQRAVLFPADRLRRVREERVE